MRRFREIEAGELPPAPDRLWLRRVGGGHRLLAMLDGAWTELTQGASSGGSSGGGLTDEERADLESRIASAVAKAEAAQKAAAAAQKSADAAQSSADTAQSSADAASASAAAAGAEAREYADGLVSGLTDGAPEALDTIKELADKALALEEALSGMELAADNVSLSSADANLSGASDVKSALELIAAKVWYTKISISSLTASPAFGTYEQGKTLAAPALAWKTSRMPTAVKLNGTSLAASATGHTLSSDVTATTTMTLTVTDEQGGTASKSGSWTFGLAVYEGMASATSEFTESWVKTTLGGKSVKTSAKGDYTMKAVSSGAEYWHIAVPTAWAVTFTTAVGEGGAAKVGEVAGFVNDEGKAVPMTVYRADEMQGSDYTITIK